MLQQTEGIILKQFKYSDNSRIVKIFTKDEGKKSFIIYAGKSGSSKNKIKILQPLFNVDIVFYKKNNISLMKLKEITLKKSYINIVSSIKKMTVCVFLSEVLDNAISEFEKDMLVYEFITQSMEFFDLNEIGNENFHIFFLIKLTKFLGFYPLNNFSSENKYFNIKEGHFSSLYSSDYSLIEEESKIFSKILKINLTDYPTIKIPKTIRNNLLEKILRFYSYHLENFAKINSLEVLKQVFE